MSKDLILHCTYQGMNLKIKEGFDAASAGMTLSLELLIPIEEMSGDSYHKVNLAQDLSKIWPDMVVVEAPRFFANATYLGKHRFEICQYVDSAYRKRVRGQLSASGIAILDKPPSTVTQAGTTDLRYDNENPLDNHHANAAYGKLVLEQMTAYAASR